MRRMVTTMVIIGLFTISCSKSSDKARLSRACTKVRIQPTCGQAELHPTHLHDDKFVASEIRAYEFQIRLIDRWTKGAFLKVVARIAGRLAERPLECLEDIRELDALSPPAQSEVERNARNTVYAVAIAFYRAERSGQSDIFREKIIAYRNLFMR